MSMHLMTRRRISRIDVRRRVRLRMDRIMIRRLMRGHGGLWRALRRWVRIGLTGREGGRVHGVAWVSVHDGWVRGMLVVRVRVVWRRQRKRRGDGWAATGGRCGMLFGGRLVGVLWALIGALLGIPAVCVRSLARACPCILALWRWFWRRGARCHFAICQDVLYIPARRESYMR